MKRISVILLQFFTIIIVLTFINISCKKEKETPESKIITDIDGNVYNTITINNQIWMVENLKTTRYRNGEFITHITKPENFYNYYDGAYCDYNNEASNSETYGRLYNWFAASDNRKIAPEGWHVATDAEWQILVDYLGGLEVAGGKLKETGFTHWENPNYGATNEVGFFALPGGYVPGNFESIGIVGSYWTSTNDEDNNGKAWNWCLFSHYASIVRINYRWDMVASIRCVKD